MIRLAGSHRLLLVPRTSSTEQAFKSPRHCSTQLLRNMSSVTTHPSLRKVSTANAPQAIGPYSQAIVSPPFVFVSGCLGFDPKTGAFVDGGVEAQARQALQNLKSVIEASGSEVGKIVKTTVFLKDLNNFGAVNAIYQDFFGEHKPARSLVEVARIPRDGLFEIEAIGSISS
ncbi:YjgF-like protein [Russula earlei]|uniref:YjgF-like protein n=1 Tax=Russula earlei TaxID=71964 RepID=A0ACC0UGY8_9AGAM|nr:YjgF-like protein [Russula earlei]